MAQLHETIIGKRLFEYTLPEIAKQLERVANNLENKEIKELIKEYPNDHDLGKKVRQLYGKS